MYKSSYRYASQVADLIQSGEYTKMRKQMRDQGVQGLINRRNQMLPLEEDTEEDPVEMVASYINTFREDYRQNSRSEPEVTEEDVQQVRQEVASSSSGGGAWDISDYDDFAARMAQSESSGRSGVQITARSSGRDQTMTGLFQFSEDRLTDYKNDTGASFSVEDFRNDEDLQRDVFAWHIADIDRVIDNNNLLDRGYDRNGLRAVAHLGGIGGMLEWVKTGGEYNPTDADPERGRTQGTSLQDYYDKFSG